MRAIWRFKAVRNNLTGFCIRRSRGSSELSGTSDEALDFAARVLEYYKDRGVLRVEARSIGPVQITEARPGKEHKIFRLRPRRNGRGWQADDTQLAHPCYHLELEEAINYAAFRGRGGFIEVQIFNSENKLQQVVLIHEIDKTSQPACQSTAFLPGLMAA
jgi:hypothetical protein